MQMEAKEEATVTISYGEAKDKYAPVGQEVSVNKGSQPNAEAGIQNKNDLPQGTTYDWKAPVTPVHREKPQEPL